MHYITPPFLKTGDSVAVIATARVVDRPAVKAAIAMIEAWGLQVIQGPNLFEQSQLFAGSDPDRLHDFQDALDNPKVSAVFCARGGYGTTRILDQINWDNFKSHPKWICGFSDVTALLNHINSLGFVCVHSTMPQLFKVDRGADMNSLRDFLTNNKRHNLSANPNHQNHMGEAQGILTGGNLSLIVHGIGTPSEIDTDGKILCLEEVDEYHYQVDRMMIQLKRAGKLKNLAGLAVGHLTKMKEGDLSFGTDAAGVIASHIDEKIPTGFGFPFGHDTPNLAIAFGLKGYLSVDPEGSKISF